MLAADISWLAPRILGRVRFATFNVLHGRLIENGRPLPVPASVAAEQSLAEAVASLDALTVVADQPRAALAAVLEGASQRRAPGLRGMSAAPHVRRTA
jgi:hypothetical protein